MTPFRITGRPRFNLAQCFIEAALSSVKRAEAWSSNEKWAQKTWWFNVDSCGVPSGKRWHNGKSQCWMGTWNISMAICSIAMWQITRGYLSLLTLFWRDYFFPCQWTGDVTKKNCKSFDGSARAHIQNKGGKTHQLHGSTSFSHENHQFSRRYPGLSRYTPLTRTQTLGSLGLCPLSACFSFWNSSKNASLSQGEPGEPPSEPSSSPSYLKRQLSYPLVI